MIKSHLQQSQLLTRLGITAKRVRLCILGLALSGLLVRLPLTAARTGVLSARWSVPINLSNNATLSCCPAIAVDADGATVVAWMEGDNAAHTAQIYYATLPAGGSWSVPANLSGSPGPVDRCAALAADVAGTVHVVWDESSSRVTSTSDIMYTQRPRGGSWATPTPATSDFGPSLNPDLAVAADGTVHLVWENFFNVYHASKPLGGPWSARTNISATPLVAEYAQVAVDGQGNIYVVWQDDRLSFIRPDIFFSTRPRSGGAWSVPLNLSNSDIARWPAVAVDGDGVLHVIWSDWSRAHTGLRYTNKRPGEGWSAPSTVFAGLVSDNDLVADTAGTIHAVWRLTDTTRIFYASRPAGGAWSAAEDISQGVTDVWEPAIALDLQDYPHVVWAHAGEVYYTSASPTSSTSVYLPLVLKNY